MAPSSSRDDNSYTTAVVILSPPDLVGIEVERARRRSPRLRDNPTLTADQADATQQTVGPSPELEKSAKRHATRAYTAAQSLQHGEVGTYRENGRLKEISLPHVLDEVEVVLPEQRPVVLPPLDTELILMTLSTPARVSDLKLLEWIKSNDVLPIIKRWHVECYEPETSHDLMLCTFSLPQYPWTQDRRLALSYATGNTFESFARRHFSLIARYAKSLVKNNGAWFEANFGHYEMLNEHKLDFAIATLLTAWHDLEANEAGFFDILLHSELAVPLYSWNSRILGYWYVLDERRINQEEQERHMNEEERSEGRQMLSETRQRVHSATAAREDASHAGEMDVDAVDYAVETEHNNELTDLTTKLANLLVAKRCEQISERTKQQAMLDAKTLINRIETARAVVQFSSRQHTQ